jgi:hypothetical protein
MTGATSAPTPAPRIAVIRVDGPEPGFRIERLAPPAPGVLLGWTPIVGGQVHVARESAERLARELRGHRGDSHRSEESEA